MYGSKGSCIPITPDQPDCPSRPITTDYSPCGDMVIIVQQILSQCWLPSGNLTFLYHPKQSNPQLNNSTTVWNQNRHNTELSSSSQSLINILHNKLLLTHLVITKATQNHASSVSFWSLPTTVDMEKYVSRVSCSIMFITTLSQKKRKGCLWLENKSDSKPKQERCRPNKQHV